MVAQIIWIVLRIIILTVIWIGTRVQVKRGDISVINAAGVIMGTCVYFGIDLVLLLFGGFFDKLF